MGEKPALDRPVPHKLARCEGGRGVGAVGSSDGLARPVEHEPAREEDVVDQARLGRAVAHVERRKAIGVERVPAALSVL